VVLVEPAGHREHPDPEPEPPAAALGEGDVAGPFLMIEGELARTVSPGEAGVDPGPAEP
jgi:hypothetical protein